ncbi:hypothetical protein BDZ94DRAFT_1373864 [Collybia nuda]|uniref:Uncharacterized protein n=1 Tax=Collybia nuda TaxID=64659 RepID=A0A9P5XRJ9_9AGAR|nr:hypothetical protein BDZ94DRAFT_1373864 [Collybia nuda]
MVDMANMTIGPSPAEHNRQDGSTKQVVTMARDKTPHVKNAAARKKSSKKGAALVEEAISTSRPRRKIQPPPRADQTPSPPPGAKKDKSLTQGGEVVVISIHYIGSQTELRTGWELNYWSW